MPTEQECAEYLRGYKDGGEARAFAEMKRLDDLAAMAMQGMVHGFAGRWDDFIKYDSTAPALARASYLVAEHMLAESKRRREAK